jgi:enamine deaminase RidA (YjgF/YER057c/UK114 family)
VSDHRVLEPPGWSRPRGYANGVRARGSVIVTAGQVGWDERGEFADGLVAQVSQALVNVASVLGAGGAGPEHLVRLTWYVTDVAEYRARQADIGRVYRSVIGRHYPAMAVVEVSALVEPKALVEIEAMAMVPDDIPSAGEGERQGGD